MSTALTVGRVAVVCVNYAPEPAGTAPFTTDLAEHLASSGFSVRVVSGLPHYPDWRVAPAYSQAPRVSMEMRNGVAVQRVRHHVPAKQSLMTRLRYEMSFAVRAAPRILSAARRSDALIAVVPGLLSAAVAALACRVFKRPLIVWLQDSPQKGASESGLSKRRLAPGVLRRIEQWVLCSAHRIIAISERFEAQIKELGVPANRIVLVRNWTFLPDPTAQARAGRSARGWGPHDWIVMHAGNMGLKQGLDVVIEAARLDQHSGVRYVLLGSGSQLGRLQEITGAARNPQFIGSAANQEYMNTLACADVLLVCERPGVADMSLPSKLTAYARSGRPVIAYVNPTGATAQEVRRGGFGIVVNNMSGPGALNEAAQSLRAAPAECARLAAKGGAFADKNYSREMSTQAIEQAVRESLHSPAWESTIS